MKKMVIMGASSGIGLHVAEELASRGVKVGLAARKTEVLLELKRKYPDNVEYERIDITHPSAIKGLNNLIEKLGGMDIYLQVAGVGSSNPELDPEEEVRVVRTNAEGFARMLSAAYNYFKNAGKPGQIAAVTSVAGTKGIGSLSAYSASKRFDSTYMTALEQRANIEKLPIVFTDVKPGWIRTPLLENEGKYPMEMTLDYAVPLIIRAIVQKKRVEVIDWRYKILVALWSLVPDAVWVKINPNKFAPPVSGKN